MRLDEVVNRFVAQQIAALQMAGTVVAGRVRVDGGEAAAYSAGWSDGLEALAKVLGVVPDAPPVQLPLIPFTLPAPPAPALPVGAVIAPAPIAFSDRELEVGRLLLQGRTRKEIGIDLHLSASTIKVYISNVYRKLDVHDMHGLRGKRELFAEHPDGR